MSERQILYTLPALPSGRNAQRHKNFFFSRLVEMKHNYPASSIQSSRYHSLERRRLQHYSGNLRARVPKTGVVFYLITLGKSLFHTNLVNIRFNNLVSAILPFLFWFLFSKVK